MYTPYYEISLQFINAIFCVVFQVCHVTCESFYYVHYIILLYIHILGHIRVNWIKC